jgi:hypothetical protein
MVEALSKRNQTEIVRHNFDKMPGWPWTTVEKVLSEQEGNPFFLEYRQLDAPNFQNGVISRYVIGVVDPTAWGESLSPKCLDYGKGYSVSAIGNLGFYFRKPSWAWEQKKIVGISFDQEDFANQLYFVLKQLIAIGDRLEEGLRSKKRVHFEEPSTSKEEHYIHLILHQLLKRVKGERFKEATEKYLDLVCRIQEHWLNYETYYKIQMVNSQKANRHYQDLEKILTS